MAGIRQARGDRAFSIINGLLLAIIFILLLYPIWFVVIASISNPRLVGTGQVLIWPKDITLAGYEKILSYNDLWIGYANTLFYTIAGTAVNLAATLPCAYALSRRDLVGRNFFMTLFVITMYFGGGMIPTYLNVRDLGLIDTRRVLLISGMVSSYNIIVSRTFFGSTIPWELHEAARIDGSSDIVTFLRIVMPLSTPIVVVMALYYGVGHWNNYFSAMIYLKSEKLYPLQLFLRKILIQSNISKEALISSVDAETMRQLYAQQDTANLAKYCVIIVSTLPMLMIYPWLQRFFCQGCDDRVYQRIIICGIRPLSG